MVTTLIDRGTLWEQRRTTIMKLATLRVFRCTLCGCPQCNDSDRIEELEALITRAALAVNELTNRICEASC